MKRIKLILLFVVWAQMVVGQNVLIKTANHYYESMSYIKAITAYEEVLKKKNVSEVEKVLVMKNLADSYLKIKDAVNGERVLQSLLSSGIDLGAENPNIILAYAKALASNSKYKESQQQFDNYLKFVENDARAKGFSKLYSDVSVLSKNAACYKVDYLSINTTAADFSPVKYQNGLVFVSNRQNATGLRRVFEWNNSPFLDLFHLDDLSKTAGGEAGMGGAASARNGKTKKTPEVGADEYTMPTANDSHTRGTFGGGNIGKKGTYTGKAEVVSDRMNKTINSKYHEGPIAFFKDGKRAIFTRNNMKGNTPKKSDDGVIKLKLYSADAKGTGWSNIAELPFNSDQYSTGHPSLSADEKLLFFVSDMPGGFGGTDIYVSKWEGSSWGAPINLGDKVNTVGNEMFPFVDEVGNLYFSSDGHPGLGDLDIFFIRLDETAAKGKATNLGVPVNSSKDDFGMITDAERKSGYFSSNRKEGGDDDDIYKFERECELIEGCELLIAVYDADTKMPLDHAKVVYKDQDGASKVLETDAEGIIKLSGIKEGFDYRFEASREGYEINIVPFYIEECEDEVSRLEIPLNKPNKDTTNLGGPGKNPNAVTCIVRGKVLMLSTKAPMEGVEVLVKNECDGSTISVLSDKDGNFSFEGVEGCSYVLQGRKAPFGSKSVSVAKFQCVDAGKITPVIYMFREGDVVEIENIYFDYGKHFIRRDAREGLDKLVDIMREYPEMKVELWSHTDSRSSKEFNQRLSDNRAKSTAEYLFKRGISRSRIVEYKGFGENQLVNGCADGVKCSEADHQLNRRTEIKVLQLH
jgi:outer membrane protein OmpA-like peptidoglycan-associated protein